MDHGKQKVCFEPMMALIDELNLGYNSRKYSFPLTLKDYRFVLLAFGERTASNNHSPETLQDIEPQRR